MKKIFIVVLPFILLTAIPTYGMESQVSILWPDFSIPETQVETPKSEEKIEQKTESAPIPEVQEEEVSTPTVEERPSEAEKTTVEEEAPLKIDLDFSDDDCQLWWIIMLLLLFINIVFISSLKIFSDKVMRAKHWRRYVYIFPIYTSISAWGIHEYLHYYHFKYPETFFCFNYEAMTFLVGGYILILYFYLIGLRNKTEKAPKKPNKSKKKNKSK